MKMTRKFKGYFYNIIKVKGGYDIYISLTYRSGWIWREIRYFAKDKKQVKFILRCFTIRYPFLKHSHYVGIMYGHEKEGGLDIAQNYCRRSRLLL